jgi:hypothetical protein
MSKTNEEVVEIPSDLETEPAKELTEDELMTKHRADFEEWCNERGLVFVVRPDLANAIPVGALGQGVQFFAQWDFVKVR